MGFCNLQIIFFLERGLFKFLSFIYLEQFNRALDTMNRAVSGHYQPGARENVAYLTSTERRRDYEAQVAQEKRDYEVTTSLKTRMFTSIVSHRI